ATNCIRHVLGVAHVRSWREGGGAVVVIRDRGRVADPLAGRVRPAPGHVGGWGLWIANQVCDLVQLRTSTAGTVVRLHVRPRGGDGGRPYPGWWGFARGVRGSRSTQPTGTNHDALDPPPRRRRPPAG